MMKSNQWISGQMIGRCSALVIVSCLFASFILLAPNYCSAVSIRGSAITLGQGFEDSEGEDHFNLAQGLRIHAYQLGLDELSFHGYFQYYGDLSNDFADEGKFRLYHGYLSYKKRDFPLNIRAGRFFLFRGVAVGVLDGGEFTYKINPQWSFTGFGGVQGPLSREWEFNPGGNSPMFGGEVRWLPGKFRGLKPSFSLSYTRQEREGDLLRHLLGLSIYLRINRKWSSLNVLHLNLEGSSLRKALTRWRYVDRKFQFSAEAGVIQPYVAAYSYFSDFDSEGTIKRLKGTVEYHHVPRKWGLGLSTLYFSTSEYGFRIGPYLIFPLGRIGYHHSWGDQPNNNVFWGNLRFSPKSYVDLYTYAASMDYEWEAMGIGSYETRESLTTSMLNVGFKIRPPFLKRTEFGAELQNYRTPQLETDRRVIVNFLWNFDYQRSE